MSPPGCQKMWVKPCNRNAEESFTVLNLKSREQKPPNPLLIQDKNVLQPRARLRHPPCPSHHPRDVCRRNADEVPEQDKHLRAGRSHLSTSCIFAMLDSSD